MLQPLLMNVYDQNAVDLGHRHILVVDQVSNQYECPPTEHQCRTVWPIASGQALLCRGHTLLQLGAKASGLVGRSCSSRQEGQGCSYPRRSAQE